MKTKILVLAILVAFATNVLSAQSLESQLKIIFGDALSTYGKNDVSRFIGKSLSTSGNMNYNMEMINARNNKNITINLPQNTSLGQDNQVIPNQGYQWANPDEISNFNVVPEMINATLPQYNINYLQKESEKFVEGRANLKELLSVGSTLNTFFTYNWVSDLNEDNLFSFDEFNGIKRTFRIGEPICFVFTFVAKCGTNSRGKDLGDNLSFLFQILDNKNGDVLAKENLFFHENGGEVRFEAPVFCRSMGIHFLPGKYLISISILSSDRLTYRSVTSLREYFEVIE